MIKNEKISNFMDLNQEAEKNKVSKDLEKFLKEMEGSTFKLKNNEKKINI